MNPPIAWIAVIFLPSVILLLAGVVPFYRYTGLGRDTAFCTLLGSIVLGGYQGVHAARAAEPFLRPYYDSGNHNVDLFISIAATGLIYPLLAALLFRLWGRWIGGKATVEEREPGTAGIRTWFCGSNVGVGILIALCAWLGYDVSPLVSATMLAAVLAAYPLLRMESPAVETSAPGGIGGFTSVPKPPADDLSAEREKILSMLEAGKLTPEESAELLQALGESARRPAPPQVPLTGGQRFMLIGAALVALGFFLPWIIIDPGKEATHLMNRMQSNVRANLGNDAAIINALSGGAPQFNTGTVSISGGDIHRGLGWTTLALALAAALLPYVATNLDTHTTRTLRLLCLGLGAFIILYLLTQNIRFIGIGLLIAIAGYALEIAGALRERRTLAA